jgi:hypothetical protein
MEIEPYPPDDGNPRCPGCRRTIGPPGALCPYCGSVYPNPEAGAIRAVLFGVAAVGIGLALLIQGVSGAVAAVFAVIGIGALIGAFAIGPQWKGRIGPAQPRQLSCCGCSCVVALLVLPSAGALLWMHGGPAMAALAVPAWIPLSWAIHAAGRLFEVDPSPEGRREWPRLRHGHRSGKGESRRSGDHASHGLGSGERPDPGIGSSITLE